jgi:outer membrane protein, multidrug efflux system
VSYGQQQLRRNSILQEIAVEEDSLFLAQKLYSQGIDDYSKVLLVEKNLNELKSESALSARDTAVALVALHKSLGGGWKQN